MTEQFGTDKKVLQILLQLGGELSARLQQLSTDRSKSHSHDSGEQAVERENDEVIDQLESDTNNELAQIKHAIERTKQGKYTTCSECGGAISSQRLKAIPYTTVCIACADNNTDM